MLEKIISVPLSIIYYFVFGSFMGIFHPIQWVCIHLFNLRWHKPVVDFLNFLIINGLNVTFNRVHFTITEEIPKNVPLILVANHQSLYDIPPIIWYLRAYAPKFIGKKELGRGLPSISINLRHNGSLLIDRKKPAQALQSLKDFGQKAKENNHMVVIYPEGTRSRDGELKPFKTNGLLTLMEQMQGGYIIPLSIKNSWKILKWGTFPLGLNNDIQFTTHRAIPIAQIPTVADVEAVRAVIAQALKEK